MMPPKNMAKLLSVAKKQARNEDKVVCEEEIGDIISCCGQTVTRVSGSPTGN